MTWTPATDNCTEALSPWGYQPFTAMWQTTVYNNNVRYDLAVLKHDNGEYLPVHGSVIMPPCKTALQAMREATKWFITNTMNGGN